MKQPTDTLLCIRSQHCTTTREAADECEIEMALTPFLEELSANELRIVRTQIFPDRWRQFCDQYNIIWQHTRFERELVQRISTNPGVYCFYVGHELDCLPPFGLSLYGGITTRSLRERCLKYFWEKDTDQGRPHVRKFLQVFEGDLILGWSEVDTQTINIKTLEKDFNDAMMPPYSVKDFSVAVRAGRNAWQ